MVYKKERSSLFFDLSLAFNFIPQHFQFRHIEINMKIKNTNSAVLSYADYQERLKNITSPEEAATLAQELVASSLANLKQVKTEDESDAFEEDNAPKPKMPRSSAYKAAKSVNPQMSPWYDVVGNDTDAMAISLYAKGLTTRDIATYLKNIHGVDISQPGISAITDKVFPLVKEWQSRPLSSCYPVVYLDGLHFKVREAGKISSKVAYIVLGVNQYGMKEVLGISISQSEGGKFWAQVLNDIKNRGVEDILITCVDGLKGFPDAIKAIFPKSEVQVCITHQIRHTIKFVPHKDKERFCNELKLVYTAPSEDAGMHALKEMEDRWPQYHGRLSVYANYADNSHPDLGCRLSRSFSEK